MKDRILDHINLTVPNIEQALEWYAQALGFDVVGRFESPTGKKMYYIAKGDITYELFEDATLETAIVDHVAYVSGAIAEDYALFKARGYELLTPEVGYVPFLWENGVDYFLMRTPTGEIVELCQKR